MNQNPKQQELPRAQAVSERAFERLERFLHIEAVSGIALLVAAAAALIWANSPAAASYQALWDMPISFSVGSFEFSRSLHFWINDGLMTVFFLVVGMEIRREMHEGALSNLRRASLPIAAAFGGVALPALVYLSLNLDATRQLGWAVPTATDIAFAVGVLALLGRSIPPTVRIFLLALAIIDDIVAVLIIAVFYSGGLDYSGFLIATAGVLLVLALQKIGVGAAYAYIIPGAVIWAGLLITGANPTLTGVILGLLTPVRPVRMRERPLDTITRIADDLTGRADEEELDQGQLTQPFRQLRVARRELLAPVVRVQAGLHSWVAYGVMPLFALANAGVSLGGMNLSAGGAQWVMAGVVLALVVGKPLGVVGVSWLMVRFGWSRLPPGVTWGGVWLVGLLAGIGFTMSIFIANLAFSDDNLLGAAKLGVLLASLLAAIIGLAWGAVYVKRRAGRGPGGD